VDELIRRTSLPLREEVTSVDRVGQIVMASNLSLLFEMKGGQLTGGVLPALSGRKVGNFCQLVLEGSLSHICFPITRSGAVCISEANFKSCTVSMNYFDCPTETLS
jgi:hypothetical protein